MERTRLGGSPSKRGSNMRVKAGDALNEQLLSGLRFLPVFTPPAPLQKWIANDNPGDGGPAWINTLSLSHSHRAASPADLVLDLVFVVLLAQLGRAFRAELDHDAGSAIRDFVALFIPIWCAWNCTVHYLNKFETKDALGAVFFVGNLLLMATAGISAERCGSATVREGCMEFTLAMAGARAWIVLFHLIVLFYNPQYKRMLLLHIVPDGIVILLWCITSLMPMGKECGNTINGCWAPFIVCWWLAIVVDIARQGGPAMFGLLATKFKLVPTRGEFVPMDIGLLAERQELFIVISIGEVVAASLASKGYSEDSNHHKLLADDGETGEHALNPYGAVALIVGLAASIKFKYFDIAESPTPSGSENTYRRHALATAPRTGLAWCLFHLPLNIAIVLLGSVLEPLKLHGALSRTAQMVATISCVSIVGCCAMITDILHSGGGMNLRRVTKQGRLRVHAGVMLVLGCVCLGDFENSKMLFLVLLNLIMFSSVAITFFMHQPKQAGASEGGGG